jgi:hypothetical protein
MQSFAFASIRPQSSPYQGLSVKRKNNVFSEIVRAICNKLGEGGRADDLAAQGGSL